MSKSKHCSGIPAGILDEDLEEYMSEKGPLEAAILALAYRNTYVAVGEMTAAIRVLENWPKWDQLIEAAEKVDKEDAIHTLKLLAEEWYSTSGEYGEGPNIEANETMKPSVEMMHAFFEALPDKEKK